MYTVHTSVLSRNHLNRKLKTFQNSIGDRFSLTKEVQFERSTKVNSDTERKTVIQ